MDRCGLTEALAIWDNVRQSQVIDSCLISHRLITQDNPR